MSKCDDGLMHIGKLAKEAGTTTRTVRYYEEMGLIYPECRSSGGFRCYSHEQLTRLRMILSLKEMEFDLEHIKVIIDKREQNKTAGELAHDILEDLNARLKEVEEQIEHYKHIRKTLTQTIASICACLPCDLRVEERLCPACQTLNQPTCQSVPFFHSTPTAETLELKL
ncbi:MAG: MerR family transcriptional regulator [Gemmatimonadetes bacterium]|nr:MerR family transcriptional regulator [Gemmatimonadota bacterium]MYC15830.1 MerR family transcriptional regulator [Gemmatimonadota bacterium]MYD62387.1 MerR family transcriptional regulator [Gemmatimonadota bacterium]MYF72804.1 MerR family transcriptional regulator [Gemmatimonadota bacterium]MYK52474.1 MerR family transcriptional regulator [Gemmatimonadota bacterium]